MNILITITFMNVCVYLHRIHPFYHAPVCRFSVGIHKLYYKNQKREVNTRANYTLLLYHWKNESFSKCLIVCVCNYRRI